MEEVRSEESLEDFVRRHKTRNQRLEARFKEMMTLAMKCNNKYIIATRNQFTQEDVEYLRGIPGLTVTDRKLPFSLGRRAKRVDLTMNVTSSLSLVVHTQGVDN